MAELLGTFEGWTEVEVGSGAAAALAEQLEGRLGQPLRSQDRWYLRLERPAAPPPVTEVRRLTAEDHGLVERAPPPLGILGFDSVLAALTGGIAAGGVRDSQLATLAAMESSTEAHAEMRVHTLPAWRNRGWGSAAAFLVAEGIRERGMVPVWSALEGEEDVLRVARKLGFEPAERWKVLRRPAPAGNEAVHRP